MLIIRFLFIKAIYIGSIDIPYVQNCLSLILIELKVLMGDIITKPVSIFPEEQSLISSAVTKILNFRQTDGWTLFYFVLQMYFYLVMYLCVVAACSCLHSGLILYTFNGQSQMFTTGLNMVPGPQFFKTSFPVTSQWQNE